MKAIRSNRYSEGKLRRTRHPRRATAQQKKGTRKGSPGLHPFNRQVFDIMKKYNAALEIAILRNLGVEVAKERHNGIYTCNSLYRSKLAHRILNKYARTNALPTTSMGDTYVRRARDALETVSTVLQKDLRVAYQEALMNLTGKNARDKDVVDTREHWKYRFWNYFRLAELEDDNIRIDSNGSILMKHAFECLFYSVYEPYALGTVNPTSDGSRPMGIPLLIDE